MGKLFIIGDSIAAGAWDPEHGGWAARVATKMIAQTTAANFLEGNFFCMPYVLAVSGDTVESALQRVEAEITPRLAIGEPVDIIFALGTNDACFMSHDGTPRYEDGFFTKNLRILIQKAHRFTRHITFVGLPAAHDAKLAPIPWAPTFTCNNQRLRHFEKLIATVCADEGLPFISLTEKWLSHKDYKTWLHDGQHPNSLGHAHIADEVIQKLFSTDFIKRHTT